MSPSDITPPGDLDEPEAFVRFAAKAAGEVDGVKQVTADIDNFALDIVLDDGETMRLNLTHLHVQTEGEPADARKSEIKNWVQRVVTAAGREVTWADARLTLLPVIRPIGFARASKDMSGGAALMRSFAPFLGSFLAVDFPDTMMYVTNRHIDEWSVTEEELFATALGNMGARSGDGIEPLEETDRPVWQINSGDYYESSRLLVPGFLASFSDRVQGRPIAIIPERSTMIIAGDADPDTVEAMAELGRRGYDESSRSISPAIYTIDDHGAVIPYLRDGNDDIANAVRMGHVLLALNEYAAQKSDLEKQFEEGEEDVFIASYTAVELEESGRPVSYAIWGEGIPTLLPRADVVHVVLGDPESDESESFAVPWDKVLALVPDCIVQEANMSPARYRTLHWPTPEQLEALQAASCELEDLT
jgi:uncharacterized protein YtpQ (UPF0354 family)